MGFSIWMSLYDRTSEDIIHHIEVVYGTSIETIRGPLCIGFQDTSVATTKMTTRSTVLTVDTTVATVDTMHYLQYSLLQFAMHTVIAIL